MRLPALLQPWSAWLALFPAEQAATLGDLLLRLNPLLGPLRRHAALTAVEPAGVGDIVQRGSYERLLISEWALADAAPDEFLRRAANGELLFTGPEPANSEQVLRSVALFDAGPSQLGAPRLVHIAMFILLARRAEAGGARFQWGLLQHPGVLHDELGAPAVRRLLGARTVYAPEAAQVERWNGVLDDTVTDCWLVGDPASPQPPRADSRILVRRSWMKGDLEVTLVQRRTSRTVTLALPKPDDCVRLLRRPFDAPAKPAAMALRSSAHSLKRAPIFDGQGGRVAAGMMDGSVTIYHVPDSLQVAPGRARNIGKLPYADSIIAAGLFHKAFGTVAMTGGALRPSGFPGPFFNKLAGSALPLPEPDMFEAVPGALRWAGAFHLLHRQGHAVTERMFVLDKAGHLVCWTRTGSAADVRPAKTEFKLLAKNVIGAVQHKDRLLFAVGLADRTDAYALRSDQATPEHLYPLMRHGERILFGDLNNWRGGRGMYALQLSGKAWLVGENAGAAEIEVERDSVVLGCARREKKEHPGLVVLDRSRKRIVLVSGDQRVTLAESTEAIAHASFDPILDRLAWLGQSSGQLTVRAIGMAQPLLQTVPKGGEHAG
jgi:hypothetical protein